MSLDIQAQRVRFSSEVVIDDLDVFVQALGQVRGRVRFDDLADRRLRRCDDVLSGLTDDGPRRLSASDGLDLCAGLFELAGAIEDPLSSLCVEALAQRVLDALVGER